MPTSLFRLAKSPVQIGLTLNRLRGQILPPPGFSQIISKIVQLAKQAYEQNLILYILTIFHDDDVIHTKIMTILSTSTSEISNVFYRNLQKK